MARETIMFTIRNIFLSLLFLVGLCTSKTIDTITLNQTLKDGDLLLSDAKSLALGFFTPGKSLGKRYVGIWHQRIPQQTVFWVANRNNPINRTSGILFIDPTGNLVIQDTRTNISVWNTSISIPAGTNNITYFTQLHETGNLVLYSDQIPSFKGRATSTTPISWQSFDHPTNTILPYMRLGVDKKQGLNLSFTSWKSLDDPGMGEYTYGMDLTGKAQVYLSRGTTRVWNIGTWNGISFTGAPDMAKDKFVLHRYTENEDEATLVYWVPDPSIFYMLLVNESGTISSMVWQGNGDEEMRWLGSWYGPKLCDTYNHCGSFGICNSNSILGVSECRCLPGFEWNSTKGENGCLRNETSKADQNDFCSQNNDGGGFLKLQQMKIPDTERARVNTTIGLEECKEMCLNNCSCTGYASPNVSEGGIGCIMWYGDLVDMEVFPNEGQDMYIRVPSSYLAQLENKSKGRSRKRLIIIVVVPIVAVSVVFLICLTMKMRKGKETISNNNKSKSYEEPPVPGKPMNETLPTNVLIFDLRMIKIATNNFNVDNKLGEGGFGMVYKGELQNGKLVAIKRLTRTSVQGIEEFKNEVTLIARLQHKNLVRLLGCCIEQEEKMLVYEYLPNKSLDNCIFDNENEKGILLNWKMRFEIISGIAQGLLYLHQDSRLRIIHRDLKASNVLLDESMCPKISDFGMARIFGEEQIEANTNRVVGTYGYMAPEYAMDGQFSVKSDVFSFGVLLLEIVSGKKNKYKYNENSFNLIGDAWDFWNKERSLYIVDPLLKESYDDREVLRCIHVGLLCVQPFPEDRPIMSEVISMLNNDTELPYPNPPGYLFKQGNTTLFSSYISSENQSVNSISITVIEGR